MGTLRAWKRMNQIRRAQFSANNGALTAIEAAVTTEEMAFAGLAGAVHVKILGAKSKSVFWLPDGAGATGAGRESGVCFAWQHGMVQP